jgi:hypothetical protein
VLFVAYSVRPIRQAEGIDPYVYTGYINNFHHLLDRHGLTYYSVRFGSILPGLALNRLLGPVGGYFALAYVFYLVAGVPLYLMVRRHFGVLGAGLGYLTFVSSVWVAATTLSQHVTAAGLVYLTAATCLILRDATRRGPAYLAVGALFTLAIHCNVWATAPAMLAALPYAILHRETLRSRIVGDALWAAAGTLVVTTAGVLFYGLVAGEWNLFRPTVRMILSVKEVIAQFPPVDRKWLLESSWLLYPPFVIAAAALTWRWPAARSRVLLAALVYALACCLVPLAWGRYGRGLVNPFSAALQGGSVVPLACLIAPSIVAAARVSTLARVLTGLVIVAIPAAWLALDTVARAVGPASLLAALGVALGVVALSDRHRLVAVAACAAFAIVSHLVFVAGYSRGVRLDRGYARMFGARDTHELETYRIAIELMSMLPRLADDGQPLRFWYPELSLRPPGALKLNGIQSTYLWAHSRLQGGTATRGSPDLGDAERAVLASGPFHLALLGPSADDVRQARAALDREGVRFASGGERRLCAGTLCLFVEVLDVNPVSGTWLSGASDAPRRTLYTADARALERSLERNLYGGRGAARALVRAADRLVFTPTSRDDHLATAFLDAGGVSGVRLTIRMPARPAGRCRAVLQSQDFRTLGTLPCASPTGVSEFAVPATARSVRLLLVSGDHRAADLPSEIRLEALTKPRG